MPIFPGLPLRSLMLDDTPGTTMVALDTVSVAKEPMRADIFAVPPGYKRSATEAEVEKTPAYASVLDDLRTMPARHQ